MFLDRPENDFSCSASDAMILSSDNNHLLILVTQTLNASIGRLGLVRIYYSCSSVVILMSKINCSLSALSSFSSPITPLVEGPPIVRPSIVYLESSRCYFITFQMLIGINDWDIFGMFLLPNGTTTHPELLAVAVEKFLFRFFVFSQSNCFFLHQSLWQPINLDVFLLILTLKFTSLGIPMSWDFTR